MVNSRDLLDFGTAMQFCVFNHVMTDDTSARVYIACRETNVGFLKNPYGCYRVKGSVLA